MDNLKQILEYHKLWLENTGLGKRANLSRANLSGANLSGANLSRANLSGAYLSGANLSGANLSGADLSRANLSEANLSEANLSRAYLSGANLSGANLSGANLSGANLSFTEVFTFTLGKHFGFYHKGEQYKEGNIVKIGCHAFPLKEWLKNFKKIGKNEGYSTKEAKIYGDVLKFLKTIK